MTQPDLFDWRPPPARATDPQTSHDAAGSIHLAELEGRVWSCLAAAGERGMTVDELVQWTGIEKVTISPRLRPLCDKGLVTTAGTRPGKSGRQQTVWVTA